MKLRPIIAGLMILSLPLHAQMPVGSWADHLTYNTAKKVAIGQKEVYVSTGSSILVFNREYSELRKLSRVQGLSETGISTIAWSDENNTLIIAYSSSNIDLFRNNVVYNIPDMNRKYIPGKKEIYKIRTNGKYAYLACSFGIVVIDIAKNEIYDTWKPGQGAETAEVFDIAFGNNKVYSATSNGVFYATSGALGLSYFGNWNRINNLPRPDAKYNAVILSGNKLYINRSEKLFAGDSIFVIDNSCSLFSYAPGVFNTSFDLSANGFTISSSGAVRIYLQDGSLQKTISSYGSGWGSPNIAHALVENGNIWIADINAGLIKGEGMSTYISLTLPGTVSNEIINISTGDGKVYMCGGALNTAWDNLWKPLQISIYENNNWNSLLSNTIKDVLRALPDPKNRNHLFVSTWGGGLIEYLDNNLINQYNDANSPLKTIIPGKPFVRICGLALDKSSNLWITQTGVPENIKILKPDGNWIVYPDVLLGDMTIGDIIITKNGYKWIILPRGNGLFVLDDKNTDDTADDRYKKMLIKDTENRVISFVYSIVEDMEGVIWIGTDQGPVIYYNPEKIFDDDPRAFRIKIPRNDGTGLADYLLGTEIITSIAVDGANRKWLGTFSSGAYLLSADGTTQIKNYNEQNSPLFSNSIVSLAIDNKSGEIWFGTSKGVISIRGDATVGEEEFKKVYVFPNPVREDFIGDVTITGLIRDSQIKITDISGNIVFETVSKGGQASWNLKTYNGRRVSTGVYLIFCASSDGAHSFVTKMLVIR